MLPFLEKRLLSVLRCHSNIKEDMFFKKHPTNDKNMVNIFLDKDNEYFFIKSKEELIYQVQMGTLEFHTWGSNVAEVEKPNYMVFDLDPDGELEIDKLRDGVMCLKSILNELKLKSFLKTSGGKGYHIVLPFSSTKNWQSFYDFSKQIALIVESKWPKEFTTNIKKIERKKKIFIDYLRNNRGSTCVAPYSVRARDNAPISMPIFWNDLFRIKPNEINVKNYKDYMNDSWNDFFQIKQSLK